MKLLLPRAGRALCRILGILALVGQMTVGGLTPVEQAAGAEIPTQAAIGDFCHGARHDAGDDGGRPCHCHDLSPCLAAGMQQMPPLLATSSPMPPAAIGATAARMVLPRGDRRPPSWWVQSGTPRGPPTIPA